MPNYETPNIAVAKKILRGQEIAAPDRMLKLADALRREDAFNYARQLFGRLRKSPLTEPELAKARETDAAVRQILGEREPRVVLAQKHALCTYKDWDIPADTRLERALEILGEAERLDATGDPETLGLAGAIYKRKWELTGQKQHLEQAACYYRRGYEGGPERDYGYTGINAAFVLDQLANVESAEARKAGAPSEVAAERARQAEEIRRSLTEKLTPLAEKEPWLKGTWWFTVTLAEAHFGLGEYAEASEWLRAARALVEEKTNEKKRIADWEFETATRQLANLARLRAGRDGSTIEANVENTRAWATLREFLNIDGRDYVPALRSAFTGKVGLALSGGGFRASLFHIGVLAKLAEKDALRSVEVLSCVSGGSIIGAHYYLEVRHLLQAKTDAEITREDYIAIVKRIEREFLEGVQRNIRVRTMAEVTTNLKTVFKKNYSHTERIGELFERELFSRVDDDEGDEERFLSKLYIQPKDEDATFTPRKDNWRRAAKAPVLVLNATTINTGHNWQFTAAWMGEPAASINSEVDGNVRLRRMYYEEAPLDYRDFRLGRAVAASACVPILFDPIVLEDLYPEMTVRLVDGGVHDNQGVAGLLEQSCVVLLVSDASGQLETLNDPKASRLKVGIRSMDMLMARVREAQYLDLDARRDAGLLRGLMYVHLKKDLDVEPKNWLGCQDPFDAADESRPIERRGALTSYGVRKDVQDRLAAIRTDLDAFSDTEAYALMASGYLMTEHQFDLCIDGFVKGKGERSDWRFLALEESMKTVSDPTLMRLLEVAQSRSLKALKLYNLLTPLRIAGLLVVFSIGAVILTLAVSGLLSNPSDVWEKVILVAIIFAFLSVPLLVAGIVTAFFVLLLVAAVKFRSRNKTVGQILVGLGLTVGGWIIARLQLSVMDKLYLKLGDIKNRADANAGIGETSPPPSAALPVRVLQQTLPIDPNNSSGAIPKVIDRFATVDAVVKLFEATGYEVTRFPRSHALNPLQIELDFHAQHSCDRVFVIVKSGAELTEPVDWRAASNLVSATWLIDEDQNDTANAPSPETAGSAAEDARPEAQSLLVLVDAPTHDSLQRFIDAGAIKVLTLNIDQIKWIAGRATDDAALREQATRWLVDLLSAPISCALATDAGPLAIGGLQ